MRECSVPVESTTSTGLSPSILAGTMTCPFSRVNGTSTTASAAFRAAHGTHKRVSSKRAESVSVRMSQVFLPDKALASASEHERLNRMRKTVHFRARAPHPKVIGAFLVAFIHHDYRHFSVGVHKSGGHERASARRTGYSLSAGAY